MLVVKFGGSSVGTAERILASARIVAEHQRQMQVVAVVSAMAGVTDALIQVANAALEGYHTWRDDLGKIEQRHRQAYLHILGHVPEPFSRAWASVEAAALALVEQAFPCEDAARQISHFSGWGERLIVDLFVAGLRKEGVPAESFAREPVLLASQNDEAEPSILATRAWLLPQLAGALAWHAVPVLPGYIALDAAGEPTTLGRNGSDHSAAIVAAALGAHALYIYSDVAGVYTADPRLVADARLLPRLSYSEVAAIAAAGARVLHPRAVEPLARWGIPLYLRSSFAPAAPGTDIVPLSDEGRCISAVLPC
ncbi:MAG TPA: aspartate kinase [Ktedonobacterales bacterium]|jgi:aspartate kinase